MPTFTLHSMMCAFLAFYMPVCLTIYRLPLQAPECWDPVLGGGLTDKMDIFSYGEKDCFGVHTISYAAIFVHASTFLCTCQALHLFVDPLAARAVFMSVEVVDAGSCALQVWCCGSCALASGRGRIAGRRILSARCGGRCPVHPSAQASLLAFHTLPAVGHP